jgi:hypothetical protein
LKGPRKSSRQKSTRSHFRSANIFFHLRKEQTSNVLDGIDVSIHATKKREEKRVPLLVCQTLPIFSAREAIECDEFEVTELQLEQESDSSEDTEGALDLVLRFFNLFNVVFFADFLTCPFLLFLETMFSVLCSVQALSPFPSVHVYCLPHPLA